MNDEDSVRDYANSIVELLGDDEEEIAVFLAGVALGLVSLFSALAGGNEEDLAEYCRIFYDTLMTLSVKDEDS